MKKRALITLLALTMTVPAVSYPSAILTFIYILSFA